MEAETSPVGSSVKGGWHLKGHIRVNNPYEEMVWTSAPFIVQHGIQKNLNYITVEIQEHFREVPKPEMASSAPGLLGETGFQWLSVSIVSIVWSQMLKCQDPASPLSPWPRYFINMLVMGQHETLIKHILKLLGFFLHVYNGADNTCFPWLY